MDRVLYNFLKEHLPIVFQNPEFCLLVGGFVVGTYILYLITRAKAAAIVSAAGLLYFVPFIKW